MGAGGLVGRVGGGASVRGGFILLGGFGGALLVVSIPDMIAILVYFSL